MGFTNENLLLIGTSRLLNGVLMERPYHHFVFDKEKRTFVGKFEEMYQAEQTDNYDSWFQEDLRKPDKQISLVLLNQYAFPRILDLGCGKGIFTHMLKKANNMVVGADVSATAIARAKARFPDIDFRTLQIFDALQNLGQFDLVLTMEVLSYVQNWRSLIEQIAQRSEYYFLTLYIPENPIGYVKSFDDLLSEVERNFSILQKVFCNDEQIIILARSHLVGQKAVEQVKS
jgi:SAM-dependent methyltransferase